MENKKIIKIKREFVGRDEDADRLKAVQVRLMRAGAKDDKKRAA